MEIKNMAYWKAKNNPSPAKHKMWKVDNETGQNVPKSHVHGQSRPGDTEPRILEPGTREYDEAKRRQEEKKALKSKNKSPAKQKTVEVREGKQYKNPKGQSQADIIDKRNKATKDYSKKVEDYSKKHGLTEKQAKKANAKLRKLAKATTTSMDSISNVNRQIDIQIAETKSGDAGDLFD